MPPNWTRENLAWLAGLYEGEGNVRWTKPNKREDGMPVGGERIALGIQMTDEDVLRRVHEIAGVGKVYGPYGPYNYDKARVTQTKPHFHYLVQGQNAYILLVAIFQWLHCRRREQAVVAMNKWISYRRVHAFTAEEVRHIRQEMTNGPRGTGVRLAKEYGVSPSTITTAFQGTRKYQWVK